MTFVPPPQRLISVVAAGFVVVVTALGSPMRLDDRWLHVWLGREVLARGDVGALDTLTYTRAGAPVVNWEWLAGAISATAWAAAGPAGLIWLRALLTVAALVPIVALWRAVAGPLARAPTAAMVGIGVPFVLLAGRINDRPNQWAFVGVAAALYVAHAARDRRVRLLWLVPITALWANLHPSWPLGPAAAAALRLNVPGGARAAACSLLRDVPYLAAALAASRASPFAFAAAAPAAAILDGPPAVEWWSLVTYVQQHPGWAPAWLFWGAGIGLCVACVSALRRGAPAAGDLVLVVAALAAGTRWVRFVSEAAWLFVPAAARLVAVLPAEGPALARTGPVAAAAALAAVMFVSRAVQDDPPVGFGIDTRDVPVGAGDFIARTGLGGRLLTTRVTGHPYLALRATKPVRVHIDGRVPNLHPPEALRAFWRAGDDPAAMGALVAAERPDIVVLDYPTGCPSAGGAFAHAVIGAGYALVYAEAARAVLVPAAAVPTGLVPVRRLVPCDYGAVPAAVRAGALDDVLNDVAARLAANPADAFAATYISDYAAADPAAFTAERRARLRALAAAHPLRALADALAEVEARAGGVSAP